MHVWKAYMTQYERNNMSVIKQILDMAINIQQVPAPTNGEGERAVFVKQKFLHEGLSDVECDELHNVYGRLPSTKGDRPLVVSAHLDTVFPADADLSIKRNARRIIGAGIGDNSLGIAGLFGLIWCLREKKIQLPGDLWLVADVGEEGLGDLKGMRRIVDRFADKPVCYIVIEGMAYGHIYHRALASRRYRITANGMGGHSWVDHGRESAIHELAKLVTQLTAIELPKKPRTTLNVGVINGGISVNTIASKAWLDLDLRSESEQQLRILEKDVEVLVKNSQLKEIHFDMEKIGSRPSGGIPEQHPLVQLALRSLEKRGGIAELHIGSTDANVPLSRGFPAICIGLTTGGAAHTMKEYICTDRLSDGMAQLLDVVRGAYQIEEK